MKARRNGNRSTRTIGVSLSVRHPRSLRKNSTTPPAPPTLYPNDPEILELAPEEQITHPLATGNHDHDLRVARHRAQCTVCRHPCCEMIDIEILDWASPKRLVDTFDLRSERTVYRHANFFGLLAKRRTSHLAALDHIIEQVREVGVNASSIVAAIRLSAQLQRRLPRAEPLDRGPVLSLPSGVARPNGADHAPSNPATIQQPHANGRAELTQF